MFMFADAYEHTGAHTYAESKTYTCPKTTPYIAPAPVDRTRGQSSACQPAVNSI